MATENQEVEAFVEALAQFHASLPAPQRAMLETMLGINPEAGDEDDDTAGYMQFTHPQQDLALVKQYQQQIRQEFQAYSAAEAQSNRMSLLDRTRLKAGGLLVALGRKLQQQPLERLRTS